MIKKDESEQIAQKCITSVARRYMARLPPNTKYAYDDLVQEGWIVYWKIITTKRIRWEGNGFPALLRMALEHKYRNIIREEYWPSRAAVHFNNQIVDDAIDHTSIDPEHNVMLGEAIAALSLVNNDIVQYLTHGTSDFDFSLIRYMQRQRKHERWTMNGMHYRWTPELVKLIFNFDVTSFQLRGYI